MGKKKSGGSRLKKKNLEQMVIALFEEQPNQVFELKTLYRELHLNTHPGQEFNYVISGKLRLSIDGHTVELEPGDSIYFNALKPHGMQAVGDEPARFLAIITAE